MSDCISEAQRKAIDHGNGPMMVLAGPGSGKTFVITRRIRNMIKKLNIDSAKILVITFTKNSAVEMQERFESLMDNEFMPVNFGTFHAVYFNIVKDYYNYGVSNIISEKEKIEYMKKVFEMFEDSKLESSLIPIIISDISKIKNSTNDYLNFGVNYISQDLFISICNEYNSLMRNMDKIDFDDMVLRCKELFDKDKLILEKWRETFQYILIDEFQDINPLQYAVIKKLVYPRNNIFVVGDDDQSIYGFRGASPEIMLNFENEFPGCEKVLLDTNYRCNNDIVEKAVAFIENNNNRFKKAIKAHKKSNKKVILKSYDSNQDEAEDIIKIIKMTKRVTIYSDVAIIFRTNNAARFITKILADNKIPYKFKEKPMSYFNHQIAKDILAILAFANGEKQRKHFLTFMNKPVRYIPRDLIKSEIIDLELMANESINKPYLYKNIKRLIYDINMLSNMSMYEAVNYILKGMEYESFILADCKRKNKDLSEYMEIINLMKESVKNIETYKDLLKYIEDYDASLITSAKDDVHEDRVNIVTMHGSKGLEYKTVIIPDINEGYIPSSKSTALKDIEEERRVFYVAMTRAKDNLYLMYLNKNAINRHPKSRFIGEIKNLEENI